MYFSKISKSINRVLTKGVKTLHWSQFLFFQENKYFGIMWLILCIILELPLFIYFYIYIYIYCMYFFNVFINMLFKF